MIRYVLMDKKTNKITKFSWLGFQSAFLLVWIAGIAVGYAISFIL